MNIFLLKIFKFLSVFLFSAFIFVGSAIYLVRQNGIQINKDVNILILGDSHTECAINDSVWNNAKNISESGSTYFFTKTKLRKILEGNNKIDTLLLSFHFSSLDKDNEINYLFNEAYSIERLTQYIPFYDFEEISFWVLKKEFIKAVLKIPIHYFKYLYFGTIKNDFKLDNMKIGSFIKSDRNKLQEDIENRNKTFVLKKQIEKSKLEEIFLNDINNICYENKVKLILINTPIYNAGKYTDTSFYYKFKFENANKFNFVDMSNKSIPQNGFGDISHLNQNGASIFTQELISFFKNNQNNSNK